MASRDSLEAMRSLCPLLVVAFSFTAGTASLAAPPAEDRERALVAHALVFGRLPTAPVAIAAADSLAALVENRRAELQRDAAARAGAARAAWLDAFGREPSEAELRAESVLALTYAERMQRHLARLDADADENRETIRRAYALVVRREPYAEEFEYWRPHGALSFVALAACLEDWARRNQPGLMVTSGTPTVPARSRFVTLVSLSPEIAAEARALLPCIAPDSTARVLAVGAENLQTPAGMHLLLVGSQ